MKVCPICGEIVDEYEEPNYIIRNDQYIHTACDKECSGDLNENSEESLLIRMNQNIQKFREDYQSIEVKCIARDMDSKPIVSISNGVCPMGLDGNCSACENFVGFNYDMNDDVLFGFFEGFCDLKNE